MTTYTFQPGGSNSSPIYYWDDPTCWAGGVVPNAPAADVVIPTVNYLNNGGIYHYYVTINRAETYAVRSVSLNDTLILNGKLTANDAFTISSIGQVLLGGATLAVGGTLTNNYNGPSYNQGIQGSGTLLVATLVNNSSILGSSLVINATKLVNAGTIEAGSAALSLNVGSGGMAGYSAGTLSKGTLAADAGGTLAINAGSVLTTDASTITLSGGTITSRDPTTGTYVPITTSLHTIASAGALLIKEGSYSFADLTVLGTVKLGLGDRQPDVGGRIHVAQGGKISGIGTLAGTIINDGTIIIDNDPGYHNNTVISGTVTGSGQIELGHVLSQPEPEIGFHDTNTVEISGTVSQNFVFANDEGSLHLDAGSSLTGTIAIQGSGDEITLEGVSKSAITGIHYTGSAQGGTLTIDHDGTSSTLHLLGSFDASSFQFTAGYQSLPADPASLIITATPGAPPAHGTVSDFNGDGLSDVLLRATDGTVLEWQFTGTGHTANLSAFTAPTDPSWKVLDTLDWNGDGHADVLAQGPDGTIGIWTAAANGGFSSPTYTGAGAGTGWTVAGTGDVNGDGKADILWYYPDGEIQLWTANATGFDKHSYAIAPLGASWKVEGLADFNGDGKDDILWRNTNGTFMVWLSNGTVFTQGYKGTLAPSWHVVGLGDFNGDGKDDILFRNTDGTISEWTSTGTGFSQNAYVTKVTNDWHVAAIGDFDGDGRSDILWRNENGSVTTWLSHATSVEAQAFTTHVDPQWTIEAHTYVL